MFKNNNMLKGAVASVLLGAGMTTQAAVLPWLTYDGTGVLQNEVVYVNDGVMDTRAEELALLAASAGRLKLSTFIGDGAQFTLTGAHYKAHCTAPVEPFECAGHASNQFDQYRQIVSMATRSGLINPPLVYRGPRFVLEAPSSGVPGDTKATCVSFSGTTCTKRGSEGAFRIRDRARLATASKPLVVMTGGSLTVAAEALLLDKSIRDKMVVIAHAGGTFPLNTDGTVKPMDTPAFNDALDLQALRVLADPSIGVRMVLFPEPGTDSRAKIGPRLTDAQLAAIETSRPSEFLRFTRAKKQITNANTGKGIPNDDQFTGDASPVIAGLVKDGFITRYLGGSYSSLRTLSGTNPDSDGVWTYPVLQVKSAFAGTDRIAVVVGGDSTVSSNAAHNLFSDSRAYPGTVVQQAPFGDCSGLAGTAPTLPWVVRADRFDWGGASGEGTVSAKPYSLSSLQKQHWANARLWTTKAAVKSDGSGYWNIGSEKLVAGDGGCDLGEYAVTNIESGEWYEYTVKLAASGTFNVTYNGRAASGATLRLEARTSTVDESVVAQLPDVTIPASSSYVDIAGGSVTLPAGTYRMRVNSVGGKFDLRNITFGDKRLARSGWTISYFDSQETAKENGRAVNVLDGNPATFWTTQWSAAPAPGYPHEVRIDMGASRTITGFGYLTRQDKWWDGTVGQYELSVSADNVNWNQVATVSCPKSRNECRVNFASRSARYIRFKALSEIAGTVTGTASAAELWVYSR